MFRIRALALPLALMFSLTACGGEEKEKEAAIRLPQKEVTWVRKEKVRTTREEALAEKKDEKSVIAINEELEKNLKQAAASGKTGTVQDKKTCLARTLVLDEKRTGVQKAGGMWHAFERNDRTKPFSQNGMQLDSQTNKMVFALVHLCKTAKGIPMDPMGQWVRQSVRTHGEETTIEKFADMANKGDAKTWIEQAEIAKQNESRVVNYKTIEELIVKAEPLIGQYEELMQRQVDDTTADAFLSDAVTLLKLVRAIITDNATMVMALREDETTPFYGLEGEM